MPAFGLGDRKILSMGRLISGFRIRITLGGTWWMGSP